MYTKQWPGTCEENPKAIVLHAFGSSLGYLGASRGPPSSQPCSREPKSEVVIIAVSNRRLVPVSWTPPKYLDS